MFFSFDGSDGVGKSTQIELFVQWLRARGHTVVTCRDPGSTQLGESIREILLQSRDTDIGLAAEMLLYMAARAQMVREIIKPSLAAGHVVVSDRYLLANVVYQGHAGGLDVDSIWQIGQTATEGIMPEVTFILDMPPEVAISRIDGKPDRLESRGSEYRARLRAGYQAEAKRQPTKFVMIDAAGSVEEVAQRIQTAALDALGKMA